MSILEPLFRSARVACCLLALEVCATGEELSASGPHKPRSTVAMLSELSSANEQLGVMVTGETTSPQDTAPTEQPAPIQWKQAVPKLPAWSELANEQAIPVQPPSVPPVSTQQVILTAAEEEVSAPPAQVVLPDAAPLIQAPPVANDSSPASDSRRLIKRPKPTPSESKFPWLDGEQPGFLGPLNGKSIMTAAGALSLVLGLFMIFAWVVKKSMPKSAQSLPVEAVAVLGRVPLAGKQFAHLLKVGDKLVLVCVMPHGCETLTEITDPVQVNHLLGLCQQQSGKSSTKAFEEIFQQLSAERAPEGFLGREASVVSSRTSAGGRARG